MTTQSKLILDADGVFLDERPYWDCALATAFTLCDADVAQLAYWPQLTEAAFTRVHLQRVTKRRGCNSNWDLAAVLAKALAALDLFKTVLSTASAGNFREAADLVENQADALWKNGSAEQQAGDPLGGFGIDRFGDQYKRSRDTFQRLLHETNGIGGARANRLRRVTPSGTSGRATFCHADMVATK